MPSRCLRMVRASFVKDRSLEQDTHASHSESFAEATLICLRSRTAGDPSGRLDVDHEASVPEGEGGHAGRRHWFVWRLRE